MFSSRLSESVIPCAKPSIKKPPSSANTFDGEWIPNRSLKNPIMISPTPERNVPIAFTPVTIPSQRPSIKNLPTAIAFSPIPPAPFNRSNPLSNASLINPNTSSLQEEL